MGYIKEKIMPLPFFTNNKIANNFEPVYSSLFEVLLIGPNLKPEELLTELIYKVDRNKKKDKSYVTLVIYDQFSGQDPIRVLEELKYMYLTQHNKQGLVIRSIFMEVEFSESNQSLSYDDDGTSKLEYKFIVKNEENLDQPVKSHLRSLRIKSINKD